MITILHDGWALVREPGSPAAVHLLAHLLVSENAARNIVALPDNLHEPLPEGIETVILPSRDSSFAHLVWVQRTVPTLKRKLGAHLIHSTQALPFGALKGYIYSPAWKWPQDSPADEDKTGAGIWDRLLESFTFGSAAQVQAVLWPEDIPLPARISMVRAHKIPPFTHPAFDSISDEARDLPHGLRDSFILYNGPTRTADLIRLFAPWRWAAEVVGTDTHLAVLAADEKADQRIRTMLAGTEMLETVQILSAGSSARRAQLYREARAVFHPAHITVWGNAIRDALICGKPLAAGETELTGAITGPAGYLAPLEDTRALGAALLTILVEESVGEVLVEKARKRVQEWQRNALKDRLSQIYAEMEG